LFFSLPCTLDGGRGQNGLSHSDCAPRAEFTVVLEALSMDPIVKSLRSLCFRVEGSSRNELPGCANAWTLFALLRDAHISIRHDSLLRPRQALSAKTQQKGLVSTLKCDDYFEWPLFTYDKCVLSIYTIVIFSPVPTVLCEHKVDDICHWVDASLILSMG